MYEIIRLDKDIDNIIAGKNPEMSDPLIQIANNIASLNKISPNKNARDSIKQAYLTKAAEQIQAEQTVDPGLIRKTFRQTWFSMRRLAAASLIFLMMSGSTAYAANSSMPDSLLYPIKRATENARLSVASGNAKTKLELAYAKRRLAEARFLAKNKPALLDSHVAEILAAVKILKQHTPGSVSEAKAIKDIMKEATQFSATEKKATPKPKESKTTPNPPASSASSHNADEEPVIGNNSKTNPTNNSGKQTKTSNDEPKPPTQGPAAKGAKTK